MYWGHEVVESEVYGLIVGFDNDRGFFSVLKFPHYILTLLIAFRFIFHLQLFPNKSSSNRIIPALTSSNQGDDVKN
jgi:hypothetical protein